MAIRVGTQPILSFKVGGAIAPSWTPLDFTDIKYWWTADAGVTESGGDVSSWEDQINGYTYAQTSSANQPTYTTSAELNNQNVILFNGSTDYMWINSAPASLAGSDMTMLFVYSIPSTPVSTNGIFFGAVIIAGVEGRTWVDGVGSITRWVDSFPNATAVLRTLAPINSGSGHAIKIRYQASNGATFSAYDTITESAGFASGTTNVNFAADAVFCIGATLNSRSNPTVFSSRYSNYAIAEAVVIYNTPTAQEMTDWETYVNNKYGTIIV